MEGREKIPLYLRLSENVHFKLFIWIPDQVGNDKPGFSDSLRCDAETLHEERNNRLELYI